MELIFSKVPMNDLIIQLMPIFINNFFNFNGLN